MTTRICKCGSMAINLNRNGRGEEFPELCDVCYWIKKSKERIEKICGCGDHIVLDKDEHYFDGEKYYCKVCVTIGRHLKPIGQINSLGNRIYKQTDSEEQNDDRE